MGNGMRVGVICAMVTAVAVAGCGDESSGGKPSVKQAASTFGGEDLYRGLILGYGPAADYFPEIRDRYGLRALVGDAKARAKIVKNYEEILAEVKKQDPEFFNHLHAELTSGDRIRVSAALESSARRTAEVVKTMKAYAPAVASMQEYEKDPLKFREKLPKNLQTPKQTIAYLNQQAKAAQGDVGKLQLKLECVDSNDCASNGESAGLAVAAVAAVAVAVWAWAAVHSWAVVTTVGYVYVATQFWGPGIPSEGDDGSGSGSGDIGFEESSLPKERAVDLITRRLHT